MSLTKTQMVTLIESDIIHRSDKTTCVGYAINWSLERLDKSGTFQELNMEEITTTVISTTFTTTDVDTSTNIITVDIDIPTGTKIVFTSTTTVPAGLTASTDYWAIRGSSTTITVASTYLLAWTGTAISLTDTGTGTHTVTAYRERIAKPDGCKFIQSIRLIDGSMSRKLEPVTPNDIDLAVPFGAGNSVGRPSHYVEWADWIQLNKIPDATYVIKIRYTKWQDAFDEDADTAEVTGIDNMIILGACMYMWGTILGEPEQAAMCENQLNKEIYLYKRFITNMKPDLVLKPSMGSHRQSASDMQTNPFSNG